MKNKKQGFILCGVFLIFIFGMTVASVLTPAKSFSENENRYLAEKPKFTIETLFSGEYTKNYETYITDQFVMRDKWIGIKTATERAMLKQDINGVYFAKDGYLIEKHEDKDIDKVQADKNASRIEEFTAKYADLLGKEHVKVMLVPTASEILVKKLPPFANGYNQNAYIDMVASKLNEMGYGDCFIDIRNSLKEHEEEYIYYRTDHHWTTLGAFYAYEAYTKSMELTPDEFDIEKVSNDFYGTIHSKVNTRVGPDEINVYHSKTNQTYSVDYDMGQKKATTLYEMDRLKTKDKYSVFLDGNHALVEVNTNANTNRRLLVIKDSFAHSFVPFVLNHFDQTFMIDFRYFNMGVEQFIEENEITDVLVLYNTINFVKDKNLAKLLK